MNEPTDFKRTFVAALETAAVEAPGRGDGLGGRQRGEHPDADRLIAYHHGELAAGEADAVQEHLTLCRQCTALVADLAAFPHLDAQPGEPSEHEVAQAWRRVEALLSRRAVAGVPDRGTSGGTPHATVPWHRAAVAWAVAACLALLCVGLGSWSFHLESRLAELTAPRPNVPVVDLGSGTRRSGDEAVARVPAGEGPFTLYFYPDVAWGDYAAFEWSVTNEAGEAVLAGSGLEERSQAFTLGLDRDSLAPGSYRLHLRGVPRSGGASETLADYGFQLDAE